MNNPDPRRARVFDKDWKYTRSEATDINVLFKRIKREQKQTAPANVTPIKKETRRA